MDNFVKIAEVLEAAAAHIDAIEAEKVAAEHTTKTNAATKLADKVAAATGEAIDEKIVEKLAETSPEISGLLDRLSGGENVDSLGGPDNSLVEKTASDSADDQFLNFIVG